MKSNLLLSLNMEKYIDEMRAIDAEILPRVQAMQYSFTQVWDNGTEEDIFKELVFCLLTPQSKARHAERTVTLLCGRGLIFDGKEEDIAPHLNYVRFKNGKAKNIVAARAACRSNGRYVLREILMRHNSTAQKREWLVKHIRGMGYKEASHFLRNVGFGLDVAILDRHILRNLKRLGLIQDDSVSLTPGLYLEIEEKMRILSRDSRIPLDRLDYVLWYREAQDVFK